MKSETAFIRKMPSSHLTVGAKHFPSMKSRPMHQESDKDLSDLFSSSYGQILYLSAISSIRQSSTFNWYDRNFHKRFAAAITFLETVRPQAAKVLSEGLEPLRTDKSFSTVQLTEILADRDFAEANAVADGFDAWETARSANSGNEIANFGRRLVRNHPFFNKIQARLVDLVSSYAGEEVEPSYNFLSLYGANGRCASHLDSPSAKWTLDICLNQSSGWPISIGRVSDWPLNSTIGLNRDRRTAPDSQFETYTLRRNEALLFSGSAQWHFRKAISGAVKPTFCNLLFLHYTPKSKLSLVDHRTWAKRFDIEELTILFDLMDR